jgi:hypothetical protein
MVDMENRKDGARSAVEQIPHEYSNERCENRGDDQPRWMTYWRWCSRRRVRHLCFS